MMVFPRIGSHSLCIANVERWSHLLNSVGRRGKVSLSRIVGIGGWRRRIPVSPTSLLFVNRLRRICLCFGSQPFPQPINSPCISSGRICVLGCLINCTKTPNSGKNFKARTGGFSSECSRFLASALAIASRLPNSTVFSLMENTRAFRMFTNSFQGRCFSGFQR